MSDIGAPAPPPDLAQHPLSLAILPPGAPLFRIHRLARDPLWFGPRSDGPQGRFDDPRGEFGVCYCGLSRKAAFAEAFLRRIPVRLLSRAFLDERCLTTIVLTRPMRVVPLHGAGLAPIGATAAVGTGPHRVARDWSRVLWEHPEAPDAIRYRSRHDDDEFSVAIFDRAADALHVVGHSGIRADGDWFGDVMNHYQLALDD